MADNGVPQFPQSLLDMATPSPNQAVLQAIAEANRAWNAENPYEAAHGGAFIGNEYERAASQPGMSGYFQYDPSQGGIVPLPSSPQQVAQQAGISEGQLLGGFSNVGNPANDQGGFFRASDLYGDLGQNVPQMFSAGAGDLSTNNWRLLGRGPGHIMRNGQVINTGRAIADRGFWSGGNPGGGVSAEHGNITPFIGYGTGAAYGYPNLFAPGYAPPKVGWPGSINGWAPIMSGAGG